MGDSTPTTKSQTKKAPKPKRTTKEKKDRKEAKAKAAEDKQTKLNQARTVKFTVSQSNGQDLYLCEDGEWRDNTMLTELGNEEEGS